MAAPLTAAASTAAMNSPAPGTALSGASVTFTWNAGSGASGYWLDVGTTQGANNLFTGNAGAATSLATGGLPTDGSTIYVRLWTQAGTPPNATWQYNDYTYTAASGSSTGTKAVMSSPAAGSTLSGASVTFTWSAGAGASAYWLDVGTTAGASNIFGQSAALATSQAVTGIATDGSTIYVRLWTLLGNVWQFNEYTYTAAAGSTKAVMSSPASGSTLSGASVTFAWSAGAGASAYWLDAGSTAGASNIFGQNIALATSQTVTGFPTDGSTIYVRLWTLLGSVWQFNDYTYTAATASGSTKVVMSSPAPGSTLGGSSVAFAWSAGSGASAYWLDVGTTAGASNIFGQNIALATSQTVSGIPTDGSTIYVRLWTLLGNVWQFNEYTYTAAAGSTKAVMSSPASGSTLSGASVTFMWNAGIGASAYWLDVGTTAGASNIFGQSAALATSQAVTGLPTDGSTICVRLWTLLGNVWQFNDYTYTAASGSTVTKGGVIARQPVTTGQVTPSLASTSTSPPAPAPPDTTGSPTALPVQTGSAVSPSSLAALPPAVTPSVAQGLPVSPAPVAPATASGSSIAPAAPTALGTTPLTSVPRPMAPSTVTTAVIAPHPFVPTAGLVPRPFVPPGAAAPTTAAALATAGGAPASGTAALLANFPTLGGATRLAFSSSRSQSTWQERGNYRLAQAPDSAGPAYAQQLAAAGWDEISRNQSGDAGAKNLQFTVDLQKDQTRGHVVLTQTTGGNGMSVTVTTLYPGRSAPALGTGVTAAPATGATTSASDRGTGDPADFPRLPGSIRTSFATSRQSTSTQEVATYTAKCPPAAADAFYSLSLPGAGWDELTRDETLTDASKSDQISAKWQNASRIAVLALSGSTAGGTDIRVTITTQTTTP
ncbi:MAG TPA: hypothetical protein VLT83_00050 [Opitutaceae bacterium]|nr:hypothetical protein [Opitutaceae bacterium]